MAEGERTVRLARIRSLGCALLAAGFVSMAWPATRAFATDLQVCHDASGDTAIAACTRAIESGALSKRELAMAYTMRGVEWRAKAELERAIIDHTDAIRKDPTVYEAFYNRGNAYRQKGDNDRAIADYTAAIRVHPNDPDIYTNRGNAYRDKGDDARAKADYARADRLKR